MNVKRSKSPEQVLPQIQQIANLVYDALGPGHDEDVYRRAMAVEFRERGIDYQQTQHVDVLYKGHWVGRKEIDFLVEGCVSVELKAAVGVSKREKSQAIAQGATAKMTSMLVNFPKAYEEEHIQQISTDEDSVKIWAVEIVVR